VIPATLGVERLGKGLGKVARAALPAMSTTAEPSPTVLDAITAHRPRRSPRHHTAGLAGALNAEWRRIVSDPSHRLRMASWEQGGPGLTRFQDLASVVAAAAASDDDHEVLTALLNLARNGDQLAARTALQALLGSLVRLARRTVAHAGGDFEESLSRAVEAAWRVIRNYPMDRTCRPADGISLDVLAALTGGGRHGSAEVPVGLSADLGEWTEEAERAGELREEFWAIVRDRAGAACGDEELIVLFAWAVRSAVITREEAQLLLRLHSPDEPGRAPTCRDVGEHLGIAHAAVRQRASRATRRLAAAVQSCIRLPEPLAA
jgi:hypothetical protein